MSNRKHKDTYDRSVPDVVEGEEERWPGKRTLTMFLQKRAATSAGEETDEQAAHDVAEAGVADGGGALPHLPQIQASFGRHDVSGVSANVGGTAGAASEALGAEAYTYGGAVAFRDQPSLHTAAHEAAHVIQQRAGVDLPGGMGQEGDAHERQADAVADKVVAGESAEELLDGMAGGGGTAGVQGRTAPGNVLGQNLAKKYTNAIQKKRSLQLRTANGVSVSGMRFAPKEIKDDGATTTQAAVQYTNRAMTSTAKLNWNIEGDAFGSTVSSEGLITPGTDTVPFKEKDKVGLRVKAVDSKEAGAFDIGTVTLWSTKFLKAKEEYPKFVGASYSAAASVGKFDMKYSPGGKVATAEMKLEFKFIDDNPDNKRDKWTPAKKAAYKQQFISQARNAWNAKFTFNNVRDPKSVWGKLNPVRLNLKLTPVNSGGHFVVEAHRHKNVAHPSDPQIKQPDGTMVPDDSASRAAVYPDGTVKMFQGDEKRDPDFNSADVIAGEQKRIDRVNPGPITFAKDSADLAANPKLDFFAQYLRGIHRPKVTIGVSGHAATGETGPNPLSRRRAQAVASFLRSHGVTQHPVSSTGRGDSGATASTDWQKAVVGASVDPNFRNPFDTTSHEFGHMLGLGDEYGENTGDPRVRSTHHGLVKDAFGEEYANQVADRADDPTANIMHFGNDVRPHDYVTFWAALGDATAGAAVPDPPFARADWKING